MTIGLGRRNSLFLRPGRQNFLGEHVFAFVWGKCMDIFYTWQSGESSCIGSVFRHAVSAASTGKISAFAGTVLQQLNEQRAANHGA